MRRAAGVTILTGLFALWLVAPALADPPGNNGTVKIDGIELDQHPNNEPHPGCLFEVDFYGFGASLDATSTFYAWPPTGNMDEIYSVVTTLDGDDSAGGGSQAGYDGGTGLIDLSPYLTGIPHPNQGFHVKVRVDVPEGSDSNAYSKYKVFWVTCGAYPLTPTLASYSGSRPTPAQPGSGLSLGAILGVGLLVVGGGTLIRRRLARAADD